MSNNRQTWNPQSYAQNARFVPELGEAVIAWLNPQAGERILDLGCGDGALSAKIAAFGSYVVGVDSSQQFIDAAKTLGIDARLMNGEQLDFDNEFHAVFSNAALHWMPRANAVIQGIWKALQPGGRFVGEMGGKGNIKTIVKSLNQAVARRGIDPGSLYPWYFPGLEDYQQRLESVGFQVQRIELLARPTVLPTGMTGWLQTFGQCYTAVLPETQRADFIAEVCNTLESDLYDGQGQWIADYVRLRFAASKP